MSGTTIPTKIIRKFECLQAQGCKLLVSNGSSYVMCNFCHGCNKSRRHETDAHAALGHDAIVETKDEEQ